ncbi:MAG: uncharacterized protein KVP18_004817 [Porospora cf. gigantea A]|nr:MAG: hypothetical protein KVP18_004817 [Porospora cf. gigantea A]
MELEFPASEDDDVSLAVKDGEGKELGRSKFVRAGSLKDKVVEFELDQDNQDEPIQSIGTINGTLGTQINDNWRVAARGKTSTLRRPPAWGAVTAAFRLKQLRNAKAKAKAEAPEEIRLSTPPSRSPRESSSGSVSGRPPPVRRFATVESVESCTSEPLDTVIQSSTAPELKVSAAAPPALKPTVLLVKEQAKALGVNRNLKETVVTKLSKERAKALGGTMKLKQTVKGPSEKRVVTQKDYLLKPAMPKTLQKLSPSERPQTLLAKTLQKPEHKEKPGVKAKTLQKIVGHKEKPGVKAKTLQKIVGHKEKPGVKAKTLQKPEHTDKSGVKAKTLQKPEHTDKSGVKAKTLEKPGHKEKPGVKSKTSQKPGHKEKPGVKAKTSQKPEHTEKPGVEAKTLEKPGHKEKPGVVTAKAPAAKTLKNLGSKGDTPVLFSEIHNASSDADAKGTNGKFKVPTRRPRQTTIELKKVKKNAGLGTKTFALTTGDVQRRKAVPKSIVVKKVNKIAVEPVASQGLRSKMRNIFRR